MHRSIRPAVILVNKRESVHAQLTEFSDWYKRSRSRSTIDFFKYQISEIQVGSVYNAAVDIYSLCVLIQETLALTKQTRSISKIDFNNFVDSNILQHSENRSTSLKMQNAITDIIDDYNVNWLSFLYFIARKNYVIDAARQENKNSIAALDLVRLLRAHDSNKFISDRIDSLSFWTKIKTNNQQILLRLIARFCYQLDLEDLRNFFINIIVKKRRKKLFQLQ